MSIFFSFTENCLSIKKMYIYAFQLIVKFYQIELNRIILRLHIIHIIYIFIMK